MIGSVPELMRAVVAHAPFPQTHVEQRMRALQNAGLLPVAVGRSVPMARPRDLARVLLGLTATKARLAPHAVHRLAAFTCPTRTDTAAEAIERWIERIFSDEREPRTHVLEIDLSAPSIFLGRPNGGGSFFRPDTCKHDRNTDTARTVVLVPGKVIAAIGRGADIGAPADAA